jgi:hypothetical protein
MTKPTVCRVQREQAPLPEPDRAQTPGLTKNAPLPERAMVLSKPAACCCLSSLPRLLMTDRRAARTADRAFSPALCDDPRLLAANKRNDSAHAPPAVCISPACAAWASNVPLGKRHMAAIDEAGGSPARGAEPTVNPRSENLSPSDRRTADSPAGSPTLTVSAQRAGKSTRLLTCTRIGDSKDSQDRWWALVAHVQFTLDLPAAAASCKRQSGFKPARGGARRSGQTDATGAAQAER